MLKMPGTKARLLGELATGKLSRVAILPVGEGSLWELPEPATDGVAVLLDQPKAATVGGIAADGFSDLRADAGLQRDPRCGPDATPIGVALRTGDAVRRSLAGGQGRGGRRGGGGRPGRGRQGRGRGACGGARRSGRR